MKKIVFFDLDGTILSGHDSEVSFFFYLLFRGYIRFTQVIKTLGFFLRWAPTFKRHVFAKNKAYLYGLPVEPIQKLGEQFVPQYLFKRIRPPLKDCIEKHRAEGDTLVLLTGSVDFLANGLAKYLHIEYVEATHCETQNNRFTDLPPKQHPYEECKLTIARQYSERLGIPLKDCVAYGNSRNDIILLEHVGNPIAVYPDSTLAKTAQKKGWTILR